MLEHHRDQREDGASTVGIEYQLQETSEDDEVLPWMHQDRQN